MTTRRAVHGDGTIYQRASDQRWVGSFLIDGKRKYVYGKTQREAREKLRQAQADQQQGRLVKVVPQTLKLYLEQWLEQRSVTLKPPFVIDALKRHCVRQEEDRLQAKTWSNQDLVFCTAHGTYYNPVLLFKQFKKLLQDAGLSDMRFHDLRHSAATMMLVMGVHPKIVQDILGHSSSSLTLDTYSHVLPSLQREASNEYGIDRPLRPNPHSLKNNKPLQAARKGT